MSSSSSSSSSSESDDSSGDGAPPPRKNQLLDDSDSEEADLNCKGDTGDNLAISVNAKFAREYEAKKRREELTKHRHGDDSDSEDSSSESEDEEGGLLTARLDGQILKTLKALRSGDERVYDRNVAFFDRDEEGGSDDSGDDGGEEEEGGGEHKPKRYKDVMREQILEQMDDEENEKKLPPSDRDDNGNEEGGKNLAYDEEQRSLRRAFLDSARDSDNENGQKEEDDSDDEGWLKPKAKRSAAELDREDEAARKLWEEELANANTKKSSGDDGKSGEGKPGRSPLKDPKGEVQDGDKFLMEFMTHRKWMEGSGRLGAKNGDDDMEGGDDDSLEELERTDAFESRYNFRFEEATEHDPSHSATASGASHSIVHYSRASHSSNALRRKDETRKQKRLERKERKAAERKAKEEKLRRLKNARREELEGRMAQVRSVLGYDHAGGEAVGENGGAGDGGNMAGLGKEEEEMILKLMEGEFDPEKFEQVMNTAYGDEYYAKEDAAWKSDGDVKRDLLADGEEVGVDEDEEGEGRGGTVEDDDAVGEEEDGNYDEEAYEDADDAQEKWEGGDDDGASPADGMDRKLRAKLQDELYKLDYEDIVGDLPTRFKYRSVPKNDYGLSTEEILFARDSTLKQFVSLKKMAPYREEEEEYRPGTKRRKRFRQMLKAEKTEEGKAEGDAGAEGKGAAASGDGKEDGKKKKRRRQKKGSGKGGGEATNVEDGEAEVSAEEATTKEEDQGEPEKKRRRRKKKKGQSEPVEATATAKEGTGTVAKGQSAPAAATKEVAASQGVKETAINPPDAEAASKKEKKANKKKKEKVKHKAGDSGKKRRKQKGSGVEGVPTARLAAYGF
ncbi:hypothetical protein ACHAXT_003696 [Thalassiosira profunda]